MRSNQAVTLLEVPQEFTDNGRALDLRFDLPLHGVSLVVLSAKPKHAPGQVTGLRVDTYEGIHGQPEFMLCWNPLKDRTVWNYQIQWAEKGEADFDCVQEADGLCAATIVRHPGRYQVVAKDYWGREGAVSELIQAGS
jgi:hypothetical protein